MKAMVVGFFASAGAAALDFFKDGMSKAKEFVRESVEVAIQADGVLHAFEKLDRLIFLQTFVLPLREPCRILS